MNLTKTLAFILVSSYVLTVYYNTPWHIIFKYSMLYVGFDLIKTTIFWQVLCTGISWCHNHKRSSSSLLLEPLSKEHCTSDDDCHGEECCIDEECYPEPECKDRCGGHTQTARIMYSRPRRRRSAFHPSLVTLLGIYSNLAQFESREWFSFGGWGGGLFYSRKEQLSCSVWGTFHLINLAS